MKVIYKFGNDISTDTIYPGRFMATVLPEETPQFAFADLDFNKDLLENKFGPNSIIVAGENFGCGSSREQAASCIKGYNLVIVAKSFARIFRQNSINLGLVTVEVPGIDASVGDELEFQLDKIFNKTTGKSFELIPLAPVQQHILESGGLIPYTRTRLLSEKTKK